MNRVVERFDRQTERRVHRGESLRLQLLGALSDVYITQFIQRQTQAETGVRCAHVDRRAIKRLFLLDVEEEDRPRNDMIRLWIERIRFEFLALHQFSDVAKDVLIM